MTPLEKFCVIAKEKFDLDLDKSSFRRTYPGYWQIKAGAWKWFIFRTDRAGDLGSCDSITDLLKNKDTMQFDGEAFHTS